MSDILFGTTSCYHVNIVLSVEHYILILLTRLFHRRVNPCCDNVLFSLSRQTSRYTKRLYDCKVIARVHTFSQKNIISTLCCMTSLYSCMTMLPPYFQDAEHFLRIPDFTGSCHMEWSAKSPDINPIEKLWAIVKAKLYKGEKATKNNIGILSRLFAQRLKPETNFSGVIGKADCYNNQQHGKNFSTVPCLL